jgi:hypothetical protein
MQIFQGACRTCFISPSTVSPGADIGLAALGHLLNELLIGTFWAGEMGFLGPRREQGAESGLPAFSNALLGSESALTSEGETKPVGMTAASVGVDSSTSQWC